MKKIIIFFCLLFLTISCSGCSGETPDPAVSETSEWQSQAESVSEDSLSDPESSEEESEDQFYPIVTPIPEQKTDTDPAFSLLFSEEELTQNADHSLMKDLTLDDGKSVTISSGGIYRLCGNCTDASLRIEIPENEKVYIVLDGFSMSSNGFPCFEVISASEVFLLSERDSVNKLECSGEENTAAISSDAKLCIGGLGSLTIISDGIGIVSTESVVITGSKLQITSENDGISSNDSVRIADGEIRIDSNNRAICSETDVFDLKGFVFICGGEITLNAGNTGIYTEESIDYYGGAAQITAPIGISCAAVSVRNGSMTIHASDTGILAVGKYDDFVGNIYMDAQELTIEMNPPEGICIDGGQIHLLDGTVNFTSNNPVRYFMNFNLGLGPDKKNFTFIVNGKKYLNPNRFLKDFDID